jgi:hypothetical protein
MRTLAWTFCCIALCCAGSASADDYWAGYSTFLELGRFDTPLRYADGEHDAQAGEFGVAYDAPIGGDVSAGLRGGYATLSVDDEPQPTALSFDGRYLGLDLRYEGTQGDYFNLFGDFSYTWHQVTGDSFSQPSSQLTWYESWLAFGPEWRYRNLRLSVGAYYQYLQGTEQDSEPSRELDFHSARGAGGYLSFSAYLDPANSLGLYFTAGARRGVKLVFRRDL